MPDRNVGSLCFRIKPIHRAIPLFLLVSDSITLYLAVRKEPGMLKVIANLFQSKKENQEEEIVEDNASEMKRMTQMRTRITHNKLKALEANSDSSAEQENQNLITRAKTQELEMSNTNKTLIAHDKTKSPSISMLETLEDRISHLPQS